MRKYILVTLVIAILILSSCQSIKSDLRDIGSEASGLVRTITLYSADGSIIDQWSGKIYVDTTDGIASFIDENNKRVILSGTYVIEEK